LKKPTFILSLLSISFFLQNCNEQPTQKPLSYMEINLDELTIEQVHDDFQSGKYNAEKLVQAYFHRIEQFDQSIGLNAIVIINPKAIEIARQLDSEYAKTGKLRPLHGVPIIVKDNYHTKGLQTTAGSISLKGFISDVDAFQIKKLKEAGAIVLAKSNMAEWAFSAKHTNSSIAGTTRNPYNLEHVPAGSSGGTAAAVAANFGLVGLGSDTGNSIRGPSSHNALVGFRSTLGLTSRFGIVPLILRNDVGGPICRTVEDATRVLEVISGYDPDDPITEHSRGKMSENYQQFLQKEGLKGTRIGVLRNVTDEGIHPEINALLENAISEMRKLGAEVIDSIEIPNFDSLKQDQWCAEFKTDIAEHLQKFMKIDSLQTLQDIIDFGKATPFATRRLNFFNEHEGRFGDKTVPCGDAFTDLKRIAFRKGIEDEMDRLGVDVLIYPSWNFPPAKIDAFEEGYKGDNSQVIAPHTGQPAFTVPMGYTSGNLPAGLQILGRMFDEGRVIKIAYSFEQGTKHRKMPDLGN
jgi:amidase